MRKINVRDARKNISRLLDGVAAGEEILITRRGVPVAKLTKADTKREAVIRFPSRQDLRAKLPPSVRTGSELIRDIRNERG